MFVRKIRSNKGIIQVGKFGIDRIDVKHWNVEAESLPTQCCNHSQHTLLH